MKKNNHSRNILHAFIIIFVMLISNMSHADADEEYMHETERLAQAAINTQQPWSSIIDRQENTANVTTHLFNFPFSNLTERLNRYVLSGSLYRNISHINHGAVHRAYENIMMHYHTNYITINNQNLNWDLPLAIRSTPLDNPNAFRSLLYTIRAIAITNGLYTYHMINHLENLEETFERTNQRQYIPIITNARLALSYARKQSSNNKPLDTDVQQPHVVSVKELNERWGMTGSNHGGGPPPTPPTASA